MTFEFAEYASPIGRVVIAVRDGRLCALEFVERWPRRRRLLERRFGAVDLRCAVDPGGVSTRLAKYFAGSLGALRDVAVDPGGSPFQRRVWRALCEVPPGCTTSYGQLARAVGVAGAARAVGAANGANPISLVIPCHRAIGADGRLTGYAAGLHRKRWLLAHEGVTEGAAASIVPSCS